MCGIVGFSTFDGDNESTLNKMMDRIIHRGPDDKGQFIDNYIALGHRRLSIIDLQGGHQPMINDNLIVVFNGEIYNYLELKQELEKKGYIFQTHSDTEVLLHGFKEYGYQLVEHLRGMFAFVIYNQDNHELYCARDPFGIKPFYYYDDLEHFLFASEIKAFLDHPFFKKEFNKDVLFSYLRMGLIPGENTFFKNVKQLLPGHYMIYKNKVIEDYQYYHLDFYKHEESHELMTRAIENVMKDSVEHHLLADVEIGSFLSSGIDSSYLVALAKPEHTYTVEYEDKRYNESRYTKAYANILNIENKSILITKDDYFKLLPKVIYHLDEPTADPSAVALYSISQLASENVKVVLSGEGADEFFGGYNTYRSDIDGSYYNKIPKYIRYLLAKCSHCIPPMKGKEFLIRNGEKIENYYIGVSPIFSKQDCKNILKHSVDIHQSILPIPPQDFKNLTNIQKKQSIDIQTWFVKDILQKGDKMTMAHSIEARVPFTDINVFHVASHLKDDQKVSKENTKLLLRKASSQVLPEQIVQKKKLGFPVPLREWMREDDVYQAIAQSFNTTFINQYFDTRILFNLLNDHQSQKNDHYKKIWAIYCLSMWHQTFFEEEYKRQA